MPEILIKYADEMIVGVFLWGRATGHRMQLLKDCRAAFLYEQYA